MTELIQIQKAAANLAARRDDLTALMGAMQRAVSEAQAPWLKDIRATARHVASQQARLITLIEANPELFVKPRTYVVDGLKYGIQKKKGSLSWDNGADLVQRIQKLIARGVLPDSAEDACIDYTAKPKAAGLADLSADQLKRLGVTVHSDTDAVLIKSVDGAVEKAVAAMVAEMTAEQVGEAREEVAA